MSSTHFTVNQTPSSHGVALYQLISTMLAAGWTMTRSSDGTTSGSGVHVTSGATGAGGLANTDAWVVLQQPSGNSAPYAGTRQIMIQVNNSGADGVRMTYSLSAGYTGGSATVSASAADEEYICGGGSPASPQFYTWINTAAPGYRCECMADDGTTGTKFPFGWYMICIINGGAGAIGGFFMDPVTNYEVGDTDPYVNGTAVGNTSAFTFSNDLANNGSTGGFTDATKAGYAQGFAHCWQNPAAVNSLPAAYAGIQGCILSDNATNAAGNLGTSPTTGNDVCLPVFWTRLASHPGTTGWKGISMMMRWRAANRSTGSTISVSGAGAKDYIVAGDVVWPWNGTSPTI